MADAVRVTSVTIDGGPTALGSTGPLSVVFDRPATAGGRGLGFNGGQLLYLSIAACVSNDCYREAGALGIRLTRVAVTVDGKFSTRGAGSGPIMVSVDLLAEPGDDGAMPDLDAFIAEVDRVAEIPNSIRPTTSVVIRRAQSGGAG